jgi:Integrase core domain
MASMSKKGDCWDNAVAESFFASIKRERLDQRIHQTRTDAIFDIVNYIDAFYNMSRRHSTVGYVSPIESPQQKPLSVEPPEVCVQHTSDAGPDMPKRSPYRPWAELLKRSFGFDVLQCPHCQGRMRLLALLTEDREVKRYLRAIGEPTELPIPESARPPPYWGSRVLRRQEPGDEAASLTT